MTEDEFKQGEQLSEEMLEWLFSRTTNSSLILVVLVKACALMLCMNKPARVSFAKQRQAFTAAFNAEMRQAEQFVKNNPVKTLRKKV